MMRKKPPIVLMTMISKKIGDSSQGQLEVQVIKQKLKLGLEMHFNTLCLPQLVELLKLTNMTH